MANSPQAEKRARQITVRRARNVVQRTRFRTLQKRVVSAVTRQDRVAAETALKDFISIADKVSGKGILHANKAARIKKRLHAAVTALPVASSSVQSD